jgi:hypothetical protein
VFNYAEIVRSGVCVYIVYTDVERGHCSGVQMLQKFAEAASQIPAVLSPERTRENPFHMASLLLCDE